MAQATSATTTTTYPTGRRAHTNTATTDHAEQTGRAGRKAKEHTFGRRTAASETWAPAGEDLLVWPRRSRTDHPIRRTLGQRDPASSLDSPSGAAVQGPRGGSAAMHSGHQTLFLQNGAAVVVPGRGACLPSLAADKKASVVVVAVHGNTPLPPPQTASPPGSSDRDETGGTDLSRRGGGSRGWDEAGNQQLYGWAVDGDVAAASQTRTPSHTLLTTGGVAARERANDDGDEAADFFFPPAPSRHAERSLGWPVCLSVRLAVRAPQSGGANEAATMRRDTHTHTHASTREEANLYAAESPVKDASRRRKDRRTHTHKPAEEKEADRKDNR
ncbi:unnamed protein product [Ixodes persulcatus]